MQRTGATDIFVDGLNQGFNSKFKRGQIYSFKLMLMIQRDDKWQNGGLFDVMRIKVR